MSCKWKVDPCQVLSHLNELGYQNINAEQLKEFIKDLKKLIKYEQRKNEPKDVDIENTPPALPCNKLSPTANNIAVPATPPLSARPKQKVISVLIRNSSRGSGIKQSPISDKSKDVSTQIKKSSHGSSIKQSKISDKSKNVSVQIKKSSHGSSIKQSKISDKSKVVPSQIKKSYHGSCVTQYKISDKSKGSSYSTTSAESKTWTRDRQVQDAQSTTTSDTTKVSVLTKNTKPSKHAKFQSNSWYSQPHLPLTRLYEPERQKIKPGSRSSGIHQSRAYIIPKRPLKTWKADPVALYHAYKNFWNTQSFPGVNNHFELRCAIRERMLDQRRKQIMSASPSIESVARQRQSSSSIL